jgi:hypothetical protein
LINRYNQKFSCFDVLDDDTLNLRQRWSEADTGKGIRLMAMYVIVYDLSLKKRSLNVEVTPLPKNDYDVALSPEGSRLAILNDRRVAVCSIAAP